MRTTLSVIVLTVALSATSGQATEIVYQPVNPAFGGMPGNGAALLNTALAQRKETSGTKPKTALEQFTETLQRSILSRISSAMSSSIVDPTSGTLKPGILQTKDFTIDIVDMGGGLLRITTTDKTTTQTTSFEVSSAI
jgi:curli production assembly/transport component CsgF